MYNNLRINRKYLKQDAKLNFFKHRNPCFAFGILLVAAELLLSLLQDRFLPFLTMEIPTAVLSSTEALMRWYESYFTNTLPDLITRNNIIIMVILGVITIMVTVPLRFAGYEIAMKINSQRETGLKDIGGCFLNGRRLLRSIGLSIVVFVQTALWAVLFAIVPVALIFIGSFVLLENFFMGQVIIMFGYLAVMIATVFTCAKYAKLSMAFYILADDENTTIMQAVREAKLLSKGRMWEIFILHFSFFWWRLLNSLVFGIISIYLVPYIDLTIAGFIYNVRAVNRGDPINITDTEDIAEDSDEQ